MRGRKYGTFVPYTENTQKGYERRPWSPAEKAKLWEHPEMSSKELAAALPGRSPKAVRNARMRFGRFSRPLDALCVACDERPVWRESREAARAGLCKGCWLKEKERRISEEPKSNLLRQKDFKARRGLVKEARNDNEG